MTAPSPWWMPHVHADRRPLLAARGRILARLREGFAARDFVEVEAAILQVSPGNEAHLHAFATDLVGAGGERSRVYLSTSPEFACKKLLAAGEQRIFQFARAFRNRERGALHHPEFTLLEWYRVGEPYESLMADCTAMIAAAAEAAETGRFAFRGRTADPLAQPRIVTVAEAFERFAGIDLLATLDAAAADRDALAAQAREAGIRLADDDTWSDIFSRVLVEKVEPQLGNDRPTLLTEYPAVEAALARRKPSDPRVAERFEAEMAEKQRLYGERYPVDEDFLAALAVMPPASGCALGFDRLVMLATGASRIEQVMWVPVAERGTDAPERPAE